MNRFKQTGPAEAGFAIGDALSSIGQTIQARRERQRQLESRNFMQAALGNVGQFETREAFFEDIFKKLQVGAQQNVDITPTLNVAATFAGLIPSAVQKQEAQTAQTKAETDANKEARMQAEFDIIKSDPDKKIRIDTANKILLDKDTPIMAKNQALDMLRNNISNFTIGDFQDEEISGALEKIETKDLYSWINDADTGVANWAIGKINERTGSNIPLRTEKNDNDLLTATLPDGRSLQASRSAMLGLFSSAEKEMTQLLTFGYEETDRNVMDAKAKSNAYLQALQPQTEGKLPEGIPEGSKKIGKNKDGNDIYEAPDGGKWVYEP